MTHVLNHKYKVYLKYKVRIVQLLKSNKLATLNTKGKYT